MSDIKLSDAELLKYAIENGIINVDTIQEKIEMNERKKFIEKHNYSIWQGKDGKFYTYLPDQQSKRGKKLVKRTSEKAIEDTIVKFYKGKEDEPTIKEVYLFWITDKMEYKEITKQTKDKYDTNFKRFFENEYLPIADRKIRYVDEECLEHFIKTAISKLQLTQKAYSDMRILINGIFKYAKKRHYTSMSITNFMGDLEISEKSFKRNHKMDCELVFSKEEERLIESFILNEQPTLIELGIILAFKTGLRAGEIASLSWSDIDDNKIHVSKTEIRYKDENGKYVFAIQDSPKSDAGFRSVIITSKTKELIKKIRAINPFGEYVFMKDGKRIKGQAFTRRLYVICEKLGITKRSIHKVRKTYATKLIDGNVPESVIKTQMGHTDIRTTFEHYYLNNKTDNEMQEYIARALSL